MQSCICAANNKTKFYNGVHFRPVPDLVLVGPSLENMWGPFPALISLPRVPTAFAHKVVIINM